MEEVLSRYDEIIEAFRALSPMAWDALVWKVRWGGILLMVFGGVCFVLALFPAAACSRAHSKGGWSDEAISFIVLSLVVFVLGFMSLWGGVYQLGAAEGVVIQSLLP